MAEWLSSLRLRLRALLRRRQWERDVRDEVAFHLSMREGQLRESGTPDARTAARRRFGNDARIRDELRDTWAFAPAIGTLLQDVRYAARTLRRSRGFSVVVIFTLAFGIGINTATFSIVNAALLRPLGFAEPERLVALRERLTGFDIEGGPFSPPDFLDLEREQQSFEAVAAYRSVSVEITGHGEPARVPAARVSAALIPLLGIPPLLGRAFTEDEDRPGNDLVVLSSGLWQTRYGGDPSIVGQTIALDRRPHTVIGVMPPAFDFPLRGPALNSTPASLWVPMAFNDFERQGRGNQFMHGVVGRLKAGVTLDRAAAELETIAARINAVYPPGLKNAGFSIDLSAVPFRDALAGRTERPLLLLLGAVGLVLLVTCANVANLVLSRAASRTRELAVRTALGSSRGRLVRLLLTEAALLCTAGSLLGLLLSRVALSAVPASVIETLPAAGGLAIDFRVLGFTAAVAVVTAILFALVPVVSGGRRDPGAALQEDASRTTPGVRRHRMQAGLVVSTVMLAVVLLVGAGLFIRSFVALLGTDAGFSPDRVLTASLTLPPAGYSTAASVRRFHDDLIARASSLPGVRSVALTTDLPLESYERRTLSPEGATGKDVPRNTNLSWVDGAYFQTLGIRLTRGRDFSSFEHAAPRWVVVVNERLARAFWPGQDPIGKRLRWGLAVVKNPNPWLTIVGVVADVADGALGTEPFLHAYEPFSQFPNVAWDNTPSVFGRHVKLAVRADGSPLTLASAIRSEVAGIDGQLAVESIATMDDRMGDVVAPRRFSAMALGAFALGSLLLAAVGLYGLLAYTVAERRREIAVRLALGAEPTSIVGMIVRQGLTLVAIGLTAGVVTSLGVVRAVESLLYQTDRHDAVTFGAVPMVLALVALLACALPAWRASRLEPVATLRSE